MRNAIYSPTEVIKTAHPLKAQGFTHIYITPKFRHGAHTTPVDIDLISVWFGPFGDYYRRDKRMPWVGEGYVDLNPDDARKLGLEDGDYVHVDADPSDRPFRGWQKKPADYKVHRSLMRVRHYQGLPHGVARSWFHMYVATYGSVEGHEKNADKLARNPRTGYQAMFRYGSHQSATRAWLKPTLQTDSLCAKICLGKPSVKDLLRIFIAPWALPKNLMCVLRSRTGGVENALWRPAWLPTDMKMK